ncbi:MAG: 4Fe-4S binding protein [Armatimonadota bacterium]|nr:4Fe-4S binding protein [Armatimonadota bacterium]
MTTEVKVEAQKVDLFEKFKILKWLAKLRSFQFLAILPNLVLFYIFILAGIFGSPIGNANIIIVFVWILWWFLLISVMVPFVGRLWCLMCPLPAFGDWLQRLALIGVRPGKTVGLNNKLFGLNKRWPKALSNIWLQNIGFLTLATVSILLVTRPIVSSIVLGLMFLLATVMALIWRGRAFCLYLCPVSGFLGLYSMTSMMELRSKDKEICRKVCKTKSCRAGSERGWACPWLVYMGNLDRNNFCGLCMECVKSCPHDNITLYWRPFCSDKVIKGYDEAWKAFIMLVLAMAYSVVLLGPWGFLKDWANISEKGDFVGFIIYAATLWFSCLLGFPAIYYIAVKLGHWWAKMKKQNGAVSLKDMFIRYSYTLVPLGLLAWVAFSLPLIMVNGSYILSVLSDPLGRGWNLFGTAHIPWTPVYPEYATYIQVALLLVGLYYGIQKGLEIARELWADEEAAFRSMVPLTVLLVAVTIAFMKLFAG